MMIVASMSTIPERKENFKALVKRILHEQTKSVDKMYVCLHRYERIDSTLPQDPRLEYYLGRPNQGPWVRYSVAAELADDDILATLDDDTIYPTDYIERGIADLVTKGEGCVVCYGGLRWSPLVDRFHYYGHERVLIIPSTRLRRDFRVAILQGICSFMRAEDVKSSLELTLPGFNTNDDLMISYYLQHTGRKIFCCSKDEGWIRETEDSTAPHALAVRDRAVRSETFHRMVYDLGFDPTSGWMEELASVPHHVVVLSGSVPLNGKPQLDSRLLALCAPDRVVHLLAPVKNSQIPEAQSRVDLPYLIHPSPVCDEGGRFEHVPFVKRWRNWRIERQRRRALDLRLNALLQSLPNVQVIDLGNGVEGRSDEVRVRNMQDFPPHGIPLRLLPTDHSRQSSAIKLTKELASSGLQPQRMLDLGCGNGQMRQFLSDLWPNTSCIGVDLESSPEVDERKNFDGVVTFDGVNLPFKDASFDLVFCKQVLEHIRTPIALIREVSRVAREGAIFVGSVSQLEPYHSYSIWNWTPYGLYVALRDNGLRLITLRPGIDAFTLILRDNGFRNKLMNSFLENESPINIVLSLLGKLLRKRAFAVNALKLRMTGHVCFVAEKK